AGGPRRGCFVFESAEPPLPARPLPCRVVLIDWDQCDDGARACRAIAAEPACADATLLGLTAAPTAARIVEMLSAGVTDVIQLPADADRLRARALQAAGEANRDTVATPAQLSPH